jgi:hypothetical protein
MTTERAIVKAILVYLNGLPGCLARKRWGGGMGVAGDPDIDACVCGRSVQLEVKRPGERPTPLQLKRIEEWRRAGAVVAVVHSVAEVRVVLKENQLLGRTVGGDPAYIVSE